MKNVHMYHLVPGTILTASVAYCCQNNYLACKSHNLCLYHSRFRPVYVYSFRWQLNRFM